MKNILVTGAAGFIGFNLVRRLIKEGYRVTGLDNINDYYSTDLKYDRLATLGIHKEQIAEDSLTESKTYTNFKFIKTDLENRYIIDELFRESNFDVVINLAAQAGVRYSLKDPYRYIDSNITGFLNVLESARHHSLEHLIYASSSSVYGANTNMPFSTSDNIDHPMSLYAASKKANELMAHTYSNLFEIPTTGLRFFTVYGPWGRPDMALFLFAEAMLKDEPIKVFNHGKMERDFTYIDDIIEGIVRLIPKPPSGNTNWSGDDPDPATSFAPYRVFNIGNSNPVKLMDFIGEIEKQLGIQAKKDMMPIQPGDVPKTWADVDDLYEYIDFKPRVGIEEGIRNFVDWYKSYYLADEKVEAAVRS
ncbi:NAD-dependent epimerase [Aliifodinibius sp. S!AR15-10]|uniref:NAD-dependent epimerase n=1 Tax=Aliifodinibius sp. S!AR15-10 TaxID=2950437 RepID=UPI002862CC59|nr:NAD-dependent epimerase [Aliifodinibius sp. S!AR15-10]MDR8392369.1 NAD-dependent epimerase [Aliifodinibius sp. S!AR15-10]